MFTQPVFLTWFINYRITVYNNNKYQVNISLGSVRQSYAYTAVLYGIVISNIYRYTLTSVNNIGTNILSEEQIVHPAAPIFFCNLQLKVALQMVRFFNTKILENSSASGGFAP